MLGFVDVTPSISMSGDFQKRHSDVAGTGRRRFLQLVGTGLASVAVGRVSARDLARSPSIRPIFSYPTPDGSADDRHERVVLDLLERAVQGATVHCSLFTLTRERIARAFVAAAERGVDVNVLLDERGIERAASQHVLDELPDRVAVVEDGGVGDRHNHNKFLTVEELDSGDQHVVWQSSSNMTAAQIHKHNASVIVRNDQPLYEAYQSYWGDLADESQNMSYNRTEEGESATVYFSPRDDFDTHIRALENVVPTYETEIHFMQSIWTASRESESGLIDRLAELIEEGADVHVIVQDGDEVLGSLRDAGADVIPYPSGDVGVHSKYMLVESDFDTGDGTTERRREVWTGSQNLSRPGLRRNDETLLRFVDNYVYDEFLDDWERVHRQASQIANDEESVNADVDGAESTSTDADRTPPAPTMEKVEGVRSTDTQMRTANGPGRNRSSVGRGRLFGLLALVAGSTAGLSYAVHRRLRPSKDQ